MEDLKQMIAIFLYIARKTINVRRVCCYSLALFFLSATLSSCNKPDAPDCFQKAGNEATITRLLDSPPNRIHLEDNIDLEIFWSDQNYVEITGPENLIPEITTHTKNGFVWISNENTCNFVRSLNPTFVVRLYLQPDFLEYMGAGNVSSPIPIEGSFFTMDIQDASGRLELSFASDSIECLVSSGVSDVRLSGSTRVAGLFNQSLSVLNASQLESEITLINSNSINDIHAKALEYLYVNLQSSGDVFVHGNPSVESVITGSGSLIITE